MNSLWTLIVFVLCYGLFVALPRHRSWVACGGAALLLALKALPVRQALTETISWNVMGLFFGTLVLAELFMLSRVPAVLAELLVARTATGRGAMLMLCGLAGVISMAVENVAVVLLIAPIALSLAKKIKASPVPLLIGIAVSSNLQGTATMIGDPPSMILAGYLRMGFFDFFVWQGRPGIFCAVQIGAIASLFVLAWIFRHHREPVHLTDVETARSWVPAGLLLTLVAGLSMATLFDPEFRWFAGTLTMALAALAVLWLQFRARWVSLRELGRGLDWDTTFFLIGVFVLVGALSESGWLDHLATLIQSSVGASVLLAFLAIVVLSVVVSGFVDNVPFLLAMIPVAQKVADQIHAPIPLLLYGLLVGACLGGNLTPIGASANVVTLGILRKQDHHVSFSQFMAIGIPFTIAAVVSACLFIWLVWAP